MELKVFPRVQPQFGRRSTLLRGTICTPGNSPMSCAVTAMSSAGARLVVASAADLPHTFRLVIDDSGFEANCTLVERSGDRAEVSFT